MGPEWPAAVKRTVPPLKAPHGGSCAGRESDRGGGGRGRGGGGGGGERDRRDAKPRGPAQGRRRVRGGERSR
jgi:hypothetical protein